MPTTSTFGLPFPASTDPFNVPTDMQALAQALEAFLVPVGTILHTIRSTAPSGWLFHNQTIANADTTFPALWAVAPASWKSGSSLVIPNLADSVLIQQAATPLGATGGANSRTIGSANLPPHTHAIDHDHAAFTSAAGSAHNHGVTDPGHTHTIAARENPVSGSLGSLGLSNAGGTITTRTSDSQTTGISTQNESAHTHSIDVPAFTGASGNGGFAGTALDTTPKHLAVNLMIKAA